MSGCAPIGGLTVLRKQVGGKAVKLAMTYTRREWPGIFTASSHRQKKKEGSEKALPYPLILRAENRWDTFPPCPHRPDLSDAACVTRLAGT